MKVTTKIEPMYPEEMIKLVKKHELTIGNLTEFLGYKRNTYYSWIRGKNSIPLLVGLALRNIEQF